MSNVPIDIIRIPIFIIALTISATARMITQAVAFINLNACQYTGLPSMMWPRTPLSSCSRKLYAGMSQASGSARYPWHVQHGICMWQRKSGENHQYIEFSNHYGRKAAYKPANSSRNSFLALLWSNIFWDIPSSAELSLLKIICQAHS